MQSCNGLSKHLLLINKAVPEYITDKLYGWAQIGGGGA